MFRLLWRALRKVKPLRYTMLVCLLFVSTITRADVLLLLSSEVDYYQETAKSLKTKVSELNLSDTQFDIVTLENWDPQHHTHGDNQPYNLIVAIGTAAAKEALQQNTGTPLLNIFTPKNAFDSLYPPEQQSPQTEPKDLRKVSAIYLDQPLERLISLSCFLNPKAKKFGTIFGPISQGLQSDIERLTEEEGINLKYGLLSEEDNPVAILKPIVSESEVFIAIPDHAILNRAIARWILYLSFQQKIPVIGFSNAYTNAGALASVYSTPENIGNHAAELIADWLKNKKTDIWNPQYPRYFTLSTNPAVARSLGISLPQQEKLYEMFKQKEEISDD